MSATKQNVFGSIPATTRGKCTLIGGDPKGENILYCCGNSVVIRNINNPLICDYYNDHQHAPTVARYSPSGFYIASGDTSGTVRIWDTTQAEHLLKIELRPLSGAINDMSWSDDSKRIVAVGDGKEKFGAAFLFDTGASVGEITGHSKPIVSCDFKKTRPYRVITGGEDFLVNWFEGPPFKYKFANKHHTRFVNCVRFSDDGNLCASVSSDKKGIFYDGKTGELKHELAEADGHKGGIYACSWSGDGKKILTASGDKTSKIWDVETGKCLTTFTFGNEVEDQQLGCIWQKDHLISMSLSGHLNFLDVNNPSKPRNIITGHNKFITAFAYDKEKKRAYTGGYDAVITSWDLSNAKTEQFTGKGHSNQINEMHIAGDNIITSAKDDSLRFTSASSKQYGSDVVSLDGEGISCSTNKDGSLVVAASVNNVHVIRGKKTVGSVSTPYGARAVSLSPSENEIAVGGADNHVYIYSLSGNNLTQTKKIEAHRGALTSVAYSPDGKLIASADTNREIYVFDAASKQIKVQGWVFHTARVNTIAWSPDSVHLASGSLDQSIIIWNVESPTSRIAIKNCHQGGVNSVSFIDNNTIASAGQDCALRTHSLKY
jgi:WD40 repeat protein